METSNYQTDIPEDNSLKELNAFQRVVGVITSPGKVARDLTDKPRILFPVILVAVAQLALYFARLPLYKDFLGETIANTAKYMESFGGIKLTSAMLGQLVEKQLKTSLIITPLGSLFGLFFLTLVFFIVFKICKGSGKFKHYLSIVGYSYVIYVLYLIVTLIVSFATNSLHLELPLTSVATLMSDDYKGTFLYGLMKGLDVFAIWQYAVIAIGLSHLGNFRRKQVSYVIVGLVFLIGIIIAGAGELAAGALI